MCTNQEIVLTRVLTKQVILYLLSVLVGILYMSYGMSEVCVLTRVLTVSKD